jgi:hypothetical protein
VSASKSGTRVLPENVSMGTYSYTALKRGAAFYLRGAGY